LPFHRDDTLRELNMLELGRKTHHGKMINIGVPCKAIIANH